jgi:hypothetical protein
MAYKKLLIDEATGIGGDYIQFREMSLPACGKNTISSGAILFWVWKNAEYAADPTKRPVFTKTYTLLPEVIADKPMVNDPVIMSQFVYENARSFIPELADAEDC